MMMVVPFLVAGCLAEAQDPVPDAKSTEGLATTSRAIQGRPSDYGSRIFLASRTIDTRVAPLPDEAAAEAAPGIHLVHFSGPIQGA